MGNVYLGDKKVTSDGWYLGDAPLFEEEESLFPIVIDGVTYEEEDAHIFIANNNYVKLALGFGDAPIFVAVDGVEMDYETDVYDWDFPGSTIHAIFDWNNLSNGMQNWYSELVQIGSRSVGDEPEDYVNPTPLASGRIPNQFKGGKGAFRNLIANSDAISNLDTSNLTDMTNMFDAAPVSDLDISKWDTSNVTAMAYMFSNATKFNGDISKWNTSSVRNMRYMFRKATAFDSDLSGWNTSNVTDMGYMFRETPFNQDISGWDTSSSKEMTYMFYKATAFNQDLSEWCVHLISSKSYRFDEGATAWEGGDATRPDWGTCPREERIKDYTWPIKVVGGKTYYKEDAHIFVANGNEINFPIPSGEEPIFVGVNGQTQSPIVHRRTVEVEGIGADGVRTTTSQEIQVASLEEIEEGDIVEAIFDWDNDDYANQNWFSDIKQFGLNSVTGERNQLKSGRFAFEAMEANPAAISNLDVSNLVSMIQMFGNASNFNQNIGGWDTRNVNHMFYMFSGATSFNSDISGWDTSKVESMDYMFRNASSFNQDLSEWCVGYVDSKPDYFDEGSGFAGQTAKQPPWGTCPRLETIPDGYSVEDCHIFVANTNAINLPLAYETIPVYIAVDGAKKDYETQVKGQVFNGSTIHAIFDWYNWYSNNQDWFSDILQFGLNSDTGKRNQLYYGRNAFHNMTANPDVIATLDVSNTTSLESAFYAATNFNQDISGWDTSHVTRMKQMFDFAYKFNSDISGWDTSKVQEMDYMFRNTTNFNQDLSKWCVSQFEEKPYYFDYQSGLQEAKQPQWGTCPRGENVTDLLPSGYELEDCHIFVANDNEVNLPIPDNTTPKFVAVAGIKKYYSTEVKGKAFPGLTIHAIFDWDNENMLEQDWFSDIKQFGLNSVTGERNQLKSGRNAFYWMTANPAAIANLDISNLTIMEGMFASNDTDSSTFNQDISGWDTSKVTNMDSMFATAGFFNQDLSQWCVSQFAEIPQLFDFFTSSWTKPKPVWGTCPRNENLKDYTWPITIGDKTYEKEDAHIFVSNGNAINFPIPYGTKPTFVGVNGETRDPIIVTRTIEREKIGADGVRTTSTEDVQVASILEIEEGDIIEAIFDWENTDYAFQDWFSDILQFGLNSETGKRNQLKSGYRAFFYMFEANPAIISTLDVSDMTIMDNMFGLTSFNQPLSGWDTSNAEDMSYMFGQSPFNQDISGWNTSKVKTMEGMFYKAPYFNKDIGGWDTSNVKNMSNMFFESSFNQDIGGWDTSKVTNVGSMFVDATDFNQDLSEWCVSQFAEKPNDFDDGAESWTLPKPVWGTCPRGEIIQLPDGVLPEEYELEDCHVFIANGKTINLPIANGTLPKFVAVNGVKTSSIAAGNGDIIHAIFDWDNAGAQNQDWFSDIIQFGLNSEKQQRNQLKDATYAFYNMTANPAAISTLDVSNTNNMDSMFEGALNFDQDLSQWYPPKVIRMFAMFSGASNFNQDISQWDTSSVQNMSWMFKDATSFNQDLSQWCVVQFTSKPSSFDSNSGFEGQTAKQPQWGNCPRKENVKDYTWPITLGGKTYEKEDAHIFVANGYRINFPIPKGEKPIFLGVNGQTKDPILEIRTVEVPEIGADGVRTTTSQEVEVASITEIENGDIVEAIFDWDNSFGWQQDWFSDILQFGLNSRTGERNQLKNGNAAFYAMKANPAALSDLDTSNLTTMRRMFEDSSFNSDISKWDTSRVESMFAMFQFASSFNQDIGGWNTSNVDYMTFMFLNARSFNSDIGGWNTSNVGDMVAMFSEAHSFNQDLSQWCVTKIEAKPNVFDYNTGIENQPEKQPQWGTCPRGEDGS
jgi:surface protein